MLQPLHDPLRRFSDQVVVAPSYVIFKEGVMVLAKNGRTGQIDFAGTDASNVIQSVIDALAGRGGEVLIKPGVYELKSPLFGASDLVLAGTKGAKLYFTGTTRHAIYFTNRSNFAVRGLTIEVKEGLDAGGISIVNCDRFLIEGNRVIGGGWSGPGSGEAPGINVGFSFFGWVRSNIVERGPHNGVHVVGSSYIHVVGNKLYDNWNDAIDLSVSTPRNQFNVVSENICYATESVSEKLGISIQGDDNVVNNNIVIGTRDWGIYVEGERNVVVGNYVRDVGGSGLGIWLDETAKDNVIMGNNVKNCSFGIYEEDGCDNVVVGNDVAGNASPIRKVSYIARYNRGYFVEAQAGITDAIRVDSAGVRSRTITFEREYPATPHVTLTLASPTATDWNGWAYVSGLTKTGFTANLVVVTPSQTPGAVVYIRWSAYVP